MTKHEYLHFLSILKLDLSLQGREKLHFKGTFIQSALENYERATRTGNPLCLRLLSFFP